MYIFLYHLGTRLTSLSFIVTQTLRLLRPIFICDIFANNQYTVSWNDLTIKFHPFYSCNDLCFSSIWSWLKSHWSFKMKSKFFLTLQLTEGSCLMRISLVRILLLQFFKSLACFIYFKSEISVMGHTEIFVSTLHYRNFCTPHYRNFWRKVDETSSSHYRGAALATSCTTVVNFFFAK